MTEVEARPGGLSRLMSLACELELLGGSYVSGVAADDAQPVWQRVLGEFKRNAVAAINALEPAAKGRVKGRPPPPRAGGEFLLPHFDREQQVLASQSLATMAKVCSVLLVRQRPRLDARHW